MRTALLVGPIAGSALLAFVLLANSGGPGAFFLAIVVALLLILAAPIIQLGLGKNKRFESRPWAAVGIAIAGVVVATFALAVSGVFNWR